jgi:hypothetical protein
MASTPAHCSVSRQCWCSQRTSTESLYLLVLYRAALRFIHTKLRSISWSVDALDRGTDRLIKNLIQILPVSGEQVSEILENTTES